MKKFYIISLFVIVAIALFLSPLASSSPDGLEKAAKKLGFIVKPHVSMSINSPIPDYELPSVKHKGLATSFAGIIGTLLTFLLVWGVSFLIYKTKKVKIEKKQTE